MMEMVGGRCPRCNLSVHMGGCVLIGAESVGTLNAEIARLKAALADAHAALAEKEKPEFWRCETCQVSADALSPSNPKGLHTLSDGMLCPGPVRAARYVREEA